MDSPVGPLTLVATDRGLSAILWKNDRFKPALKHVGTEFVRISW